MAENQTINQITAEELSKDIEFNLKSDINESKMIFNENLNYNSQSFNQNSLNQERVKEGINIIKQDIMSSSNSILSSTPYKHQYFLHSDKNSEFHGAFNNFHNILDHKNYLMNHSKNYLNLPENSKQFVLSQNSFGKSISIPNTYGNKNKNIFQTFNKMIKSKNFKILKDEKEQNNFSSRKIEGIEKINSTIPIKKIKQNEGLFEHLISKILYKFRCK